MTFFNHKQCFNPIQDGGGEGGWSEKALSTSLFPATSTTVAISAHLTFSFNPFLTLV